MRTASCIQIALLSVAMIAMAGCRSSSKAPEAPRLPSISGTISLGETTSVPGTATLAVRLVDLGRNDAARIVVEQVVSQPGEFPYKFRIYYNTSSIDFSRDYGIEASVIQSGRPMWVPSQPAPVLTKGRPQVVDLLLQRAR
jgi:copper homeostasis protein (lipoprotein)